MKKVLFLIDSLGSGGAQRQVLNLVNSEQSYDLAYYRFQKSPYTIDDTTVKRIKSESSLIRLQQIRRLSREYDVICPFLITPSIYAFIATLGLRKRFLYNVRNKPFVSRWPYPLIEFILMLISSRIITNSYHAKDSIPRFLHHKTRVMYNGYNYSGVEIEHIAYYSSDILIVGRISKQKNTLNVIKAIIEYTDKYIKQGERLKLKIVGRIEEDYLKSWTTCITLLESRKNKIDYEHIAYTEDVDNFYKSSRVLLHATLWEGTPNVVCEAMLNGCPVIISDRSDWRYLTQNSSFGTVTGTDVDSIIKSLYLHFNKSEDELIESCNAARAWAEKHLSLNKVRDKFTEILNEV